jgi:hypothetical protein
MCSMVPPPPPRWEDIITSTGHVLPPRHAPLPAPKPLPWVYRLDPILLLLCLAMAVTVVLWVARLVLSSETAP